MAPPGLLFLLLMSPSLFVYSLSQQPKPQEIIKKGFSLILDHREEIRQATGPVLELLKVTDPRVKAVIDIIVLSATGKAPENEVLTTVVNEFQNLNFKLDQYHKELKWDSWAAGAYHKPELKIKEGRTIFITLLRSLAETKDAAKRQNHIKAFKTSYAKCEPATRSLRELLTATETTFINNLGLMLAEHVKCDQNAVKQYSAFIETLVFEGNFLNQFFYHLTETDSSARLKEAAEIQYDVASAIFEMQKYCINQIMNYVEKDATSHIDKKKDRAKLAEEVRVFLEKKDDKYEWMVVAFKAQNSDHSFVKIRNKHTLTGFTVVTKDGVSVGVARQLKGQHTKAGKIREAIKKCFKKLPFCYKVEKELRKCQEKVDNVPVSQTYTAVHALHGSAHESHTEVKSEIISAYENINPDTISLYENVEYDVSSKFSGSEPNTNIYTGRCAIFTLNPKTFFEGKFQVMFKSDGEITNDPCSKLKCGTKEQGQCVTAGSPSIAMCECNYPYYGKNCGQN